MTLPARLPHTSNFYSPRNFPQIDVAGKNDVLGAKDSSSAVGVAVRVYSLGSRVHGLPNVLMSALDLVATIV
mgnify:CR=1 FL=1